MPKRSFLLGAAVGTVKEGVQTVGEGAAKLAGSFLYPYASIFPSIPMHSVFFTGGAYVTVKDGAEAVGKGVSDAASMCSPFPPYALFFF